MFPLLECTCASLPAKRESDECAKQFALLTVVFVLIVCVAVVVLKYK